MNEYILTLDQGTTSCRSILYDREANIIGISQKEFTQIFPQPSWVEHDAMEIWDTQLETIHTVIKESNIDVKDIKAVGITNQRETTVVWNKETGKPVANAIVWQCRRTAELCGELSQIPGFAEYIKNNTGLVIDAYFSAIKIKWIFDNIKGVRELADQGKLLFGTIDTWLLYQLTGGECHITDYSNASRTMLYNIKQLCWDNTILDRLNIPSSMLPKVVASSGICAYVHKDILGHAIPISGIAGDQQAALFGQGCFNEGEAKNTYGTGCFLLMNTGRQPIKSKSGLLTTIAWGVDGKIVYALEGSVFVGGAIIQWLRDQLGLIESAAESCQYALSVDDTNGVYVVPAFTGLGAPFWDMNARGLICGLTRGAGKAHIIRAALESVAYQTMELLNAVQADSDIELKELMVDGGACANDFLMQFQADILGKNVNRPVNTESTSLGAMFLAGLGAGVFKDISELKQIRKINKIFTPSMDNEKKQRLIEGWQTSVKMCMSPE